MSVDTWPPEDKKKTIKEMDFEEQQEHLNSLEAVKQNKIDEQVSDDRKENQYEMNAGRTSRVHYEEGVMEELKDSLKETMGQDSVDTTEKPSISQEVEEKPEKNKSLIQKGLDWLKGGSKKAAIVTAFTLGGATAVAGTTEKNPEDSLKNTTEKIDLSSARKVTKQPPGYKKVGTVGNKTFFHTENQGKTLEPAKPGATSKETPAYKDWLIQQIKDGISVQELVDKDYISPAKADEYKQYEKQDLVYIETEPKVNKIETKINDGPIFAKSTERYFGANKHAVADIAYAVRNSKDKTDGGMLNTAYGPVKVQLLDEMGRDVGEPFIVPGEEMQNYTVANSTHFKSDEAFKAMKEKYAQKTFNLTGDQIVQGTTLR